MFLAILFALATDTLVPFNDLGTAPYAYGYYGGLYDNGTNVMPPDHFAGGLRQASLIRPLDANGNPSPDGKVVFLTVGFGETGRIAQSFQSIAANDRRVDHQSLVLLDASHDGFDAYSWFGQSSAPNYNRIHDDVLMPAGVTENQVQAAWVELVHNNPQISLPPAVADAYLLKGNFANVAHALKQHYPNLQIAYLSSRVYGGYATTSWNPEPFAYEAALSVRWVILGQATFVRTGFLWDTRINSVDYTKGEAPWLAWGPYLWANGTTPRSDGLTWQRDDFNADGETLSAKGAQKGATLLLDFLLNEPTAANWFRAAHVPTRARAVRP